MTVTRIAVRTEVRIEHRDIGRLQWLQSQPGFSHRSAPGGARQWPPPVRLPTVLPVLRIRMVVVTDGENIKASGIIGSRRSRSAIETSSEGYPAREGGPILHVVPPGGTISTNNEYIQPDPIRTSCKADLL